MLPCRATASPDQAIRKCAPPLVNFHNAPACWARRGIADKRELSLTFFCFVSADFQRDVIGGKWRQHIRCHDYPECVELVQKVEDAQEQPNKPQYQRGD